MLTPCDGLLYSLRPFEGHFAFPARRSFIYGQARISGNKQASDKNL